ncbi:MAG: ribonuclease J [Oscillospiraceae bacterium]|jgi:ribonuclease J|nr:ribonuclease J [Oscillospiraceae bacterium]
MSQKLKIIPLGGINEVGKNLTVYEHGGDILLVDCGLSFPDEDMFGVDIVIPDFTYLEKHKNRVRALCVTHGHEDHIGAVSFLLRVLNCPIYCTRLTAGLIKIKLDEAGLSAKADIRCVEPGQIIQAGSIDVEFIHVNHSIAGAAALAVHTPLGTVIHTGDFKIDSTPVDGDMIDLARLGELGRQGVLALLSDSTNVERPGFAMSERTVGEALLNQFRGCEKRIVVTTFASNIHRIQQIINAAVETGRKVAITGRSMENILALSIDLGCIDIPPGTIVELSQVKSLPRDKVCVITTGSQGEPMSALHRMAFGAHRQVDLGMGDRVIVSASPVPGNEKTVSKMIDELFKRGCEVVYRRLADIHVSGHACQEELKIILALTRPKYFIPVHGEYRMMKTHADLAALTGVPYKNTLIPELGRPIEVSDKGLKVLAAVPSGRVLVDGMGPGEAGDVGSAVLHDRQHLATDGILLVVVTMDADGSTVVAGPDIITRGFALPRDSDAILEELRRIAADTLDDCIEKRYTDWATIKQSLRSALSSHLNRRQKGKPLILPVIMEV